MDEVTPAPSGPVDYRAGSFWGGYGVDSAGVSYDSKFDVVVTNWPTQTGWGLSGLYPQNTNPWYQGTVQYNRPGVHENWLAFNSQIVAAAGAAYQTPMDRLLDTDYQLISHPELYDLNNTDYASIWASRAIDFLLQLNDEQRDCRFTGIFADSICGAWWWGGGIPPEYVTTQNYRDLQTLWCEKVQAECSAYGLKFGANIASHTGFYGDWPDVFEHVDFAIKEHVYLRDAGVSGGAMTIPDPALLDPDRTYRIGIHIEPLKTTIGVENKTAEMDQLLKLYVPLLRPGDCIIYGGGDRDDEGYAYWNRTPMPYYP